jgi:hypothetical protein
LASSSDANRLTLIPNASPSETVYSASICAAVDDMRAPMSEIDRVAVRRGVCDAADADSAGGAGDVFNKDIDSNRPDVSVGPPAANGTTMVMGRVG